MYTQINKKCTENIKKFRTKIKKLYTQKTKKIINISWMYTQINKKCTHIKKQCLTNLIKNVKH